MDDSHSIMKRNLQFTSKYNKKEHVSFNEFEMEEMKKKRSHNTHTKIPKNATKVNYFNAKKKPKSIQNKGK